MTITFLSDLRDMTYKHYLQQPKSLLEWRLNLIIAKNPQLIEVFDIGIGIASYFHTLIRKYSNFLTMSMEKIKILFKSFQVILSK